MQSAFQARLFLFYSFFLANKVCYKHLHQAVPGAERALGFCFIRQAEHVYGKKSVELYLLLWYDFSKGVDEYGNDKLS